MKEKHTYHPVDALDNLPDALRTNPYVVPHDYFEKSHQRILLKCQYNGAASATFVVPSGYFEQLRDDITARIAEQKLKTIVDESGFTIPEGYFGSVEGLSRADQKIRKEVTEPGFTVPEHYFETLQNHIVHRTSQHEVTPIRKINRPRWMAYAAAACIALVMGITGIFRGVDDSPEKAIPLASVSDQEILNYLELYGTTNDMIYISEHLDDFDEPNIGEGISEMDIEAYLNHTL